MHIYYLTPKGEKPARILSNPTEGASHSVTVHGEAGWYAARAKALEHAAEAGADFCMVVVGHCIPTVAGRDGANLREVSAFKPNERSDHSVILYMRRLLEQHHGAVLLHRLEALRGFPWSGLDLVPTVPLVACYRIAAAMSCDYTGPRLEYSMVTKGFRTYTPGDFGYWCHGRSDVLDTFGTPGHWKRAYEKALAALA